MDARSVRGRRGVPSQCSTWSTTMQLYGHTTKLSSGRIRRLSGRALCRASGFIQWRANRCRDARRQRPRHARESAPELQQFFAQHAVVLRRRGRARDDQYVEAWQTCTLQAKRLANLAANAIADDGELGNATRHGHPKAGRRGLGRPVFAVEVFCREAAAALAQRAEIARLPSTSPANSTSMCRSFSFSSRIFAPPFSNSRAIFDGLPSTVKSRSRSDAPVIKSRTVPPVRYRLEPIAAANSCTRIITARCSGDSRLSSRNI